MPNCRIGQEAKGKRTNTRYPGPGNYNIPSQSIEGPKFGMGGKNFLKNK